MPSPFPGMDPFLEQQPWWEIFHAWFIRKLAEFALPKAIDMGCAIDVERDVYEKDPSGEMVLIGEPDDVFMVSGEGSSPSDSGAGIATLAAPRAVHEIVLTDEPHTRRWQDYLVVRNSKGWPRVLAVAELLSPANKSGKYAGVYHAKRSRLLASRTHFMEIDFLRAGKNPLREHFPELDPTPYFVFVARKNDVGRNEEGYPIRLQDPLPTIGLPLWGGRPDLPLDLDAAFRSAYELTLGGRPLDFANERVPDPPLSPGDAKWAADLLSKKSPR
jgi:hypothetical protein